MVKFFRNGTLYEVPDEVAGELLSSTVAALIDARDGVDLAKSGAYINFQKQMTLHVYQPKAPRAEPVKVARHAFVAFDEVGQIDQEAYQRCVEAVSMFGYRQQGKSIYWKVNSCRRAYSAMLRNMSSKQAIIRLSERYGVSTEIIRQWVGV